VKRIAPEAVAFGAPAITVLLISAMLTLRRDDAVARPQPKRFSGSVVVQRLPSLLASPQLPAPLSVVVVRDEAAISFYNSPVALDSIVAVWRSALEAWVQRCKCLVHRCSRSANANVFVVPSSPCLTVATRDDRGRGVTRRGCHSHERRGDVRRRMQAARLRADHRQTEPRAPKP
jgi:hypothetical protein